MKRPGSKEDYWLTREPKEVANFLCDFHSAWSLWNMSPFRQAWLRNFLAYYSPVAYPGAWDTSLTFEGVQGELVRMFTPQARVMIRQLVTIVTKTPLAAQCIAETSGDDVMADVKLGNAICDQLIQKERLDTKGDQLVEQALVLGQAFTKTTWRTDKGREHAVSDDGSIIYEGEVSVELCTVFDTFYDVTIPQWDQMDWVEVRTQKNRFNLMAEHPEMAGELAKIPSVREDRGPNTWFDYTIAEDDYIYVYELFAKPSPTLPRGRYLVYADSKCILVDGDNPYGCIPVEPLRPEAVIGTGLAYPQFTNLMACQEMLDNSLSAIATNQSQFAVQSVTIPRGAGVNVQELGGMRFVSFTPQNVPGGGKPEPLQLSASSPETFKFVDVLKTNMLEMSNINGALRGTPPPGVTSGVAIATLSANAIEFTSSIAKAYTQCMEKTLMHSLNAYKRMSKVPHNVAIKGRNNQSFNRPFDGTDLTSIGAVKINITNPILQTVGGRIEVAEKLLAMPREVWPDYVSILEGRPLSDIYKVELSQEDLIHAENEKLMMGEQVPSLSTDDHPKHVQSHAGILNDPNVRLSGEKNQIVLDHILEHVRLSKETDPYLTAMIRTGKMPDQPPQGAPPQGPPPGMGGGPEPQLGGLPTPHTAKPAPDMLGRGA